MKPVSLLPARLIALLGSMAPLMAAAQIGTAMRFKGVIFTVDRALVEKQLIPAKAPVSKDGPLFTASDPAELYKSLIDQSAAPRGGSSMVVLPDVETTSGQTGMAEKNGVSIRIDPILGKDGERVVGHILVKTADRAQRGTLGAKVGEPSCPGAYPSVDPNKLEVLFFKAEAVK
ncbi:hypothetical protein OVA24_17625 [Luteolibacter sp. SL250]|uniref:hypothetical protein n=1 Tax=Luteolibacter sp. SL250 TaxID=2995170 RepID=UPI00226E5C48|nr:hypothetical protein [Luteolibacter sp. SL250]WAC19050.1 hypothetical protein OVA24_17625 [Luteolibacter sp. SL250]